MTRESILAACEQRSPTPTRFRDPVDARKAKQELERRKGLEKLSADARERNARFNHFGRAASSGRKTSGPERRSPPGRRRRASGTSCGCPRRSALSAMSRRWGRLTSRGGWMPLEGLTVELIAGCSGSSLAGKAALARAPALLSGCRTSASSAPKPACRSFVSSLAASWSASSAPPMMQRSSRSGSATV
jgi:hypothetical protein